MSVGKLKKLERSQMRSEFDKQLFQKRERQMISHDQVMLVVTTVDAAMGGPTTGSLAAFGVTVGSKTALWSHETERSERSQPIKPLSRIRGEREHALLRADGQVAALCPLFDERSDPRTRSQFRWHQTW
jgi:hypothetical protein